MKRQAGFNVRIISSCSEWPSISARTSTANCRPPAATFPLHRNRRAGVPTSIIGIRLPRGPRFTSCCRSWMKSLFREVYRSHQPGVYIPKRPMYSSARRNAVTETTMSWMFKAVNSACRIMRPTSTSLVKTKTTRCQAFKSGRSFPILSKKAYRARSSLRSAMPSVLTRTSALIRG